MGDRKVYATASVSPGPSPKLTSLGCWYKLVNFGVHTTPQAMGDRKVYASGHRPRGLSSS